MNAVRRENQNCRVVPTVGSIGLSLEGNIISIYQMALTIYKFLYIIFETGFWLTLVGLRFVM